MFSELEAKESGIKLIVGLGNPGPQYENTRHNVGAWLLQHLTEISHLNFSHEPKLKGWMCKHSQNQQQTIYFIPSTFMNESGQAVQAVAHFYRIKPEQILVAHDELDFTPGVARLKTNGGHGGHNGLRDIINKLGSNSFHRIRIGIGRPQHSGQVSSYVLSKPNPNERTLIHQAIEKSVESITLLTQGKFNQAFLTLHSE